MKPLQQETSRDETAEAAPATRLTGGRPRCWASAAAKHRAHRQRQAQGRALVAELLRAVRNARLQDPGLHRVAQEGDDLELLHALAEYYRARHWQLGRKEGEG